MIIRPYGSEKFDKPGFETFYEAINIDIRPYGSEKFDKPGFETFYEAINIDAP